MSLYNEDELTPPKWINQEFLQKVLSTHENEGNVEIVNFDLSPASVKGDHYASIMFRCKISYRVGKDPNTLLHISVIIKTLPEAEGMKRELLMESHLFETEIDMYTKTLPKIEQILAKHGESTKLSAKIFYHSLEPHKVLVLEDLCESGYDTVRFRFLTEEEMKAVYRKIAKLHAVSYLLGHSEDHAIVTQYEYGIFNSSLTLMKEIFSNGLRNFGDLLSSSEEFQRFHEKFKSMEAEIPQACKDLNNAYKINKDSGDIFVLNHGDFHMKNIMFKFSKGNVLEDLIMVDYQISCYAPSTIDTTYSQYMMLTSDLRLKRHELMEFYFSEFIRVLKKINYPGELPVYSQFHMSALKYRHYTICCLAVLLPLVSGFLSKSKDELKDIDSAKFIESPDMIAQTYQSTEFLDDIRKFMPLLLAEGYFN